MTSLANNARRFRQTFNTGDTTYRSTVAELGLFANARVAIRPGLSLTAGLRFAGASGIRSPAHANAALLVTQRIPNDFAAVAAAPRSRVEPQSRRR